jgi:hypothetical protein
VFSGLGKGGPGQRLCSHPSPSTGLIDTCRDCGARALELMQQLQDQQALSSAQPGLVRSPLQGILQLGQVSMGWGWGSDP